ncbi:hypothetical protein [Actinomadura sp. 6N118]|uniref:hypothetical protein n=1 Tax=Actinomadura sp. 6N118 TaxID=3375151 RepID=UPI003787D925
MAGGVRKTVLALLAVCVLVSHDQGRPLLGVHHGRGFTVGHPAGWIVDDNPGLVEPLVMSARPFWRQVPALRVGVRSANATPEKAVENHLKEFAYYDDFVLKERTRVAVGGGAVGYLLHMTFSQVSSDNERFPSEETTLVTTTGRGEVLEVEFHCEPSGCGPRDPTVRAIMSTVTVS